MLCNDLEGWDAGGGLQGGSKARGYVYTYSWFTLLYNRNEHNLVKQLYFSFSLSVVSYSLGPHGLQHTRLPCPSARQASLSFSISQSWHKLMSMESVMPSNHLIRCHPLSYYLKSFPVSESFLMSRLFVSNGQLYSIKKNSSVIHPTDLPMLSFPLDRVCHLHKGKEQNGCQGTVERGK